MLLRFKREIPSSEITPQGAYRAFQASRRNLLKGIGAVGVAAMAAGFPEESHAATLTKLNVQKTNYTVPEQITPEIKAQSYNNFYEFGEQKDDPAHNSGKFKTRPWTIKVEGLVKKPQTFDIDTLMSYRPMEERVYRFRCVEAWSMVIPWAGYSLAEFIKAVDPLPSAKFVQFISAVDRSSMELPAGIEFPYMEGLRMDEAMHPLTLLTFGSYGETLANQQGAPVRIIVPWKYGFKSAKSVVRIKFIDKMPSTTWNDMASSEYGFYSNVNPTVDHPRWSQASERRIDASNSVFVKRVKTLPFNGYANEVAGLYAGMDLKKYF